MENTLSTLSLLQFMRYSRQVKAFLEELTRRIQERHEGFMVLWIGCDEGL